jgi:hypothetical protein
MAEVEVERGPVTVHRVGWGFIVRYTLAYISTSLLFLAPLLVTLALKVNSLVGIEQAPKSLALVTGTGALLAVVTLRQDFTAVAGGDPGSFVTAGKSLVDP